MRFFFVSASLAGAALLAACSDSRPTEVVNCPLANVGAPIEVEIRDAATLAPLAAGTRAIARSSALVDTLHLPFAYGGDTTQLAERWSSYVVPGSYTVEVQRAGYRPWSASSVRIVRNASGCGVSTVHLTALLTPA